MCLILMIWNFLKISQNSQGNTCVRVSFLIKLQASGPGTGKFCDISKNNFSHRTPPLNASEGIPLDFPCQLFRIMYGKLDLLDPSTTV